MLADPDVQHAIDAFHNARALGTGRCGRQSRRETPDSALGQETW